MQWQDGSILTNPALRLANVPAFASMNDLGMDFQANPELATSNSNLVLSYSIAIQLFNTFNTTDQLTLLNPDNMY